MMQTIEAATRWAPRPASDVERAAQIVRSYQGGLEQTFVLIATEFPKIFSAITTLVDRSPDDKDLQTESVRTILHQSREVAEDVRAELTSLMQANQRALETSEKVAAASAKIAAVVENVGRVGWALSLTGLNASVMAAHTHDDGLAFATLTHALTTLADDSAREARALQASATELARLGEHQASAQVRNAVEHRSALEGAEDHLRKATEGIADSVVAVSDIITDARARTRAAMATIARIMAAVQREDILRQKLDHLLIVLDELRVQEEPSSTPEREVAHAAFMEQSGNLVNDLWVEVRDDVTSLVDDIVASLEQLRPAVELADLPMDSVDALRTRALQPMRELSERLASLEHAPKANLGTSAQALELGAAGMKKRLKEIHDCTRQLSVLHVLIRIEAARTPALADAGTIATQIAGANDQLRELLATSFEANASLDTQLESMRSTAKELERRDATVLRLTGATQERTRTLDAAADSLGAHLEQVRAHGANLRRNVEVFKREIEQFSTIAHGANVIVDISSRLTRDAARVLAAHGDVQRPPVSPRMLELIDRFTVLSHKTIAAGIVDVTVESGDAGGDVTLF